MLYTTKPVLGHVTQSTENIVIYLKLYSQHSHSPQLFPYLTLQIGTRKVPIVASKNGRKSSIPETHGTTSLASYTLLLERKRVCKTSTIFNGIKHDTQDIT